MTKSTDGRLPFEPKKKSKKSDSDSDVKATNSPNNGAKSSASEKLNQPVKPSPKAAVKTSAPKPANGPKNNAADGIPTEVSQRMVRRASLFCGIPTSLSFVVFLGSYFVTVNHIFTLPNAVVVSASFLCFGLGVVGLTYGALSASWDEGRIGGFWGWQECTKNFGYLRSAWQEQKALNQAQALKAKAAAKQAAIKKITAPPTDQKTSSN